MPFHSSGFARTRRAHPRAKRPREKGLNLGHVGLAIERPGEVHRPPASLESGSRGSPRACRDAVKCSVSTLGDPKPKDLRSRQPARDHGGEPQPRTPTRRTSPPGVPPGVAWPCASSRSPPAMRKLPARRRRTALTVPGDSGDVRAAGRWRAPLRHLVPDDSALNLSNSLDGFQDAPFRERRTTRWLALQGPCGSLGAPHCSGRRKRAPRSPSASLRHPPGAPNRPC